LRINRIGGGLTVVETNLSDWVMHPTDSSVDLAVLPMHIHRESSGYDLAVYPLEPKNIAWPFQETGRKTHDISDLGAFEVGDDVFFPGLFVRHQGEERNIPIVRTGTIAAMGQERVMACLAKNQESRLIDAYLVEARSIGGLSGSPVFLYSSGHSRRGVQHEGPSRSFFLGIMQGHYDRKVQADSSVFSDEAEKINMGIGIVIPATKLLEILDRDDLRSEREKAEREYEERLGSPTAD
jgi:hypothetical protein